MSNWLIKIQRDCDEAVRWMEQQLTQANLQVVRTFDLQRSRVLNTECSCPHHGTGACDCQMVVLLVYGIERAPVSLIVHSHDGQTSFSLASTPLTESETALSNTIQDILALA